MTDQQGSEWKATHRHRKGSYYRVLTRAMWEHDCTEVVVYDEPDGCVWVREAAEFDDGRFVEIN